MADDNYFAPRHATPAERAVLDKALGRSIREITDPEIAALRTQLAEVTKERDEARANYRFMVERAANEKFDGYRELGARAANAENKSDELQAELTRAIDFAKRAGHLPGCASLGPGYMVGGISMSVDVRPNAHEVKHTCTCGHDEVVG